MEHFKLFLGEESVMRILSPAFSNGSDIPERYTCAGLNVNPCVFIEDIPPEAKSFCFVVDDPDSANGYWVHWVVYDIPIISQINEDSVPGKQGLNSFNKKCYSGPCPSEGKHRYFFTLYAIDKMLNLDEGITIEDLKDVMTGHVIAEARLLGLFEKAKSAASYEKVQI